jgi:WD40 repeat protein
MAVPNTTGVMRTNLADMQIGDYIPCTYNIPSINIPGCFYNLGENKGIEIPYAGINAQDQYGLFYFVKVDKGTCVADRVIHNSVKWDYIQNYIKYYYMEGKILKDLYQRINQPATMPSNYAYAAAISPDDTHFVVGGVMTGNICIYKKDSTNALVKLSNPSTLPTGQVNDIKFSADGNYMAVAHATTPFLTVYKREGDVFTKLNNPATLPAIGTLKGVAISTDGIYYAICGSTAPYVTIYKKSEDTLTKLADPDVLPTGISNGITFSPDGTYLVVAHNTTPYVTIYKRNGDVFTKLNNPAALPTSSGYSPVFTPSGNKLVIGHSGVPYATAYDISNDTFTKNITMSAPTLATEKTALSPDGKTLVFLCGSNGLVFSDVDLNFAAKSSPLITSVSSVNNIAFSNSGKYFITATNSYPYIVTYQVTTDNILIRSLSGGCSFLDANGNGSITDCSLGAWPRYNEWDRYITNSDLKGKIVAGDDNVWHWSNAYTATHDTTALSIAASTNRTFRGKDSVNKMVAFSYVGSDTTHGFRPVLEYMEPDTKASNFYY